MESNAIDVQDFSDQKLPKFVIMLLMGLPGSGKTTLCRIIPFILGEKYHVLHVCFDNVVQFHKEWSDEGNSGRWKSERAKVIWTVEEIIKGFLFRKEAERSNKIDRSATTDNGAVSSGQQGVLKSQCLQSDVNELISGKNIQGHSSLSSVVGPNPQSSDVFGFDDKHKILAKDLHRNYSLLADTSVGDLNISYQDDLGDKIIVLCVDDNFYYHSMRKEWWNLAVRYELAFCTLVVNCEVETCIERVKKREYFNSNPDSVYVPVDVIKRMYENIELPNHQLCHWEKHWSVIDTSSFKLVYSKNLDYLNEDTLIYDEIKMQSFENINRLVVDSLFDPAKSQNAGMYPECVIATPSIIHEVDLALRRIVGRSDKTLKAIVNKKRKDILERLKNGKHYIPKELTEVSDKETIEKYVVSMINLEEINQC